MGSSRMNVRDFSEWDESDAVSYTHLGARLILWKRKAKKLRVFSLISRFQDAIRPFL